MPPSPPPRERTRPEPPPLRTFASADELARFLAEAVAKQLRAAIEQRHQASLVVSGGSTPIPFFRALSNKRLDWPRVFLTLADERWVPTTAKESNEALVRTHLLCDQAATAHFIGLKTEAASPRLGQQECTARLMAIARPFDVVILGMGSDGHTASLFPHGPELAEALAPAPGTLCLATTSPTTAQPRMTLTRSTLLEARLIMLHITGQQKLAVYRQALDPGPVAALPIRAFLHQQETELVTCWAP